MPITQPTLRLLSTLCAALGAMDVAVGPASGCLRSPAPPEEDERQAFAAMQAEEPAIDARRKRIEDELAELARNPPPPGKDAWAAEWAGKYYTGDGLGMNAMIMIAPKSGVTYTWHGCMGLYDGNHGDIAQVLPDGLRATLVLDERKSSYQYMSSRLYFIRSGAHRFIIPAALMINYVNRRNGVGDLIMPDPPCRFEGNNVERNASPGDDFKLPPEFEALLIRRPITLTVVRTSDVESGLSPVDDLVVRCRVDLKSDPPVYPGLEVHAKAGLERGWITIDRVDGESCTGSLLAWGPATAKPTLPQPGDVFALKGAPPADPFTAALRAEEPAIIARRARIDAELAELTRRAAEAPGQAADEAAPVAWAAEWAGVYSCGNGLGMNVQIALAPRSGVTYTWHGCAGLYDGNHGDIAEVLPDGLNVHLAIDETLSLHEFMSARLYFVRWGDQRFLIPEAGMMEFIRSYNAGGFHRRSMRHSPRKENDRAGDRSAPPGPPELPPQYAALLLTAPIQLTVTAVSPVEQVDVPTELPGLRCRLDLTPGRDRGIYDGLVIEIHHNGRLRSLRIDRVDEHSCSGTISAYFAKPETFEPPPIGTVFEYPPPDPFANLK